MNFKYLAPRVQFRWLSQSLSSRAPRLPAQSTTVPNPVPPLTQAPHCEVTQCFPHYKEQALRVSHSSLQPVKDKICI